MGIIRAIDVHMMGYWLVLVTYSSSLRGGERVGVQASQPMLAEIVNNVILYISRLYSNACFEWQPGVPARYSNEFIIEFIMMRGNRDDTGKT